MSKTINNVPAVREKIAAALDAARDEIRSQIDAGEMPRVSISRGNSKMGDVPSVSLVPYFTCPAGVHCAGACYAAKLANFRPSVLAAWARNTVLALEYPAIFWAQVRGALAMTRFFRFHVSGDIPNVEYYNELLGAARDNSHCSILVFTENRALVNNGGEIPENLKIRFSGAFLGIPADENPRNIPETRIINEKFLPADNWKICPGNCFNCACRGTGCWTLQPGETIAFRQH